MTVMIQPDGITNVNHWFKILQPRLIVVDPSGLINRFNFQF